MNKALPVSAQSPDASESPAPGAGVAPVAQHGRALIDRELLAGQMRVLEMVATGKPLAETLDQLTRFIEAQEEGLRCGILIVADDGKRFERGSGPKLPEACHRALVGATIAPPFICPCAEAAFTGATVVAPDIANDPRWPDEWRRLALSLGLEACRSTPVLASDGSVLGSLAMYYPQPRDPSPAHPRLIETATHLAGIAIEQARSQAELRSSEERLQAELAATRHLQEISTALIREGDGEALHHRLLEAAIGVMRSDMASMQIFDEARHELRLIAWKGFHPASAEFWTRVRAESDSTCGEALESGQRIVVPDVESCDFMAGTADLDAYRQSGIRAVQSTPLFSRAGRVLGMISTHWRDPHQPSEHDFRLLDLLARQAADLIERAHGEQALRERTEQLEAVLETAPAGVWFTHDREVAHATGNRQAAAMFHTGEYANLSLGAPENERPPLVICRGGKVLAPDELPLQRAARGEQVGEEELEFRYADGGSMTVLLRASTLRDSAGEPAGAVAAAIDISARKHAEVALREQTDRLETLNRIGKVLSSDLDLDRVVQAATDSATELSGAKFGAFFYNVTDDQGESYMLYALSGAPREAFDKFELPRNTAVFGPTFDGIGIVRSDDIRADPRYGRNAPHHGMPKGHLPVVSYLAAPVVSRSGEVHGGLFFGHDRPGVFTREAEDIVAGIAAHAAVAIDNARLLKAAQTEIGERRRVEAALRESEERLRAIFDSTSVGAAILTPARRFVDVNDALCAITGYSAKELRQLDCAGLTHPDDRPKMRVLIEDLLAGRKATLTLEKRYIRKDGGIIWVQNSVSLIRDAAGQPEHLVMLCQDISERKHAEAGLREADLRKNIALGAGQMGVWDWNIVENRLVWDDAEFAIYGADRETFALTYEGFESLVHPDDIEQFKAAAEGALKMRTPLDTEFRILRPDGQERWISERAVNITDDRGEPVRMVGVSFDITERKKADERRNLLINELNHRVKNTLATVQSIASQTLKNSHAGPAVREAFESRLISLSKAHDVLTRQNWEGARLGEIAAQSLSPFGSGPRIVFSGPEIRLTPKAALAISMALHELATNAVKYGALSDEEGTVEVEWEISGERLSFHWRESGGPPVEPPRRKGFGSRLIDRSLAGELGGKVQMEYLRSGVVCRIEAPLSNVAG